MRTTLDKTSPKTERSVSRGAKRNLVEAELRRANAAKKKTAGKAKVSAKRQTGTDEVIEAVLARASEVMGNQDTALRWMGTPVRGLDFATPISLLGSEEGRTRVLDILGQVEHGIW